MPRKYHKPPDTTTKRRKSRKTAIPYEFEAPPQGAADVDGSPLEVFEDDDGLTMNVNVNVAESTSLAARSGMAGKQERHVTVDYAYVRREIILLSAIIACLVISLVITSIFR